PPRSPPDLHSFPTRRSSDLRLSHTKNQHRPDSSPSPPQGQDLIVVPLDAPLEPRRPRGAEQRPHLHHREHDGDPERVNPAIKERSEEHTSELQSQSNLVCRL